MVAIDVPFDNLLDPPLSETDGGTVVSGDAGNILFFNTDGIIDASGDDFNFILVTNPIATAGLNAQEGFENAMGVVGEIDVNEQWFSSSGLLRLTEHADGDRCC